MNSLFTKVDLCYPTKGLVEYCNDANHATGACIGVFKYPLRSHNKNN